MDRYPLIVNTAIGFALSYTLCGICRWLAPRLGFVDSPNEIHKKHKNPTPLFGGVAVLAAFVVVLSIIATPLDKQFVLMIISAGFMCILGLVDDRWSLAPRIKFAGQILICLPAAYIGFTIERLTGFGFEFTLGSFSPFIILLWLAACTNAINLLDGLDGVVGLVSTAICIGIACLVSIDPNAWGLGGEASIYMAGCLFGFVVHNWHPARLYLGDAGSLSIGLLIGMLALRIETDGHLSLNVPRLILLFAVPLTDMVFAMTRRVLSGRSIASPDNDHLHHRLHAFGLSVPGTALLTFSLAGCGAIAAVYSKLTGQEFLACSFCFLLFAALAAAGMFGDTEFRSLRVALREWVAPSPNQPFNYSAWVQMDRTTCMEFEGLNKQTIVLGCDFSAASESRVRLLVICEQGELSSSDIHQLNKHLKSLPTNLLVAGVSAGALDGSNTQLNPMLIPFDGDRIDPPDYQNQSAA